MARQHEIIQAIMETGKKRCVWIEDGKKFGTLLGELLKMLTAADERITVLMGVEQTLKEVREEVLKLRSELERKTPHGLRRDLPWMH